MTGDGAARADDARDMPRAALPLLTTLALMATPATAAAQSLTTSLVGGEVGTQLAIQVEAPDVMSIGPASSASSSALITVISTVPSWTLSVHDASGTTPGYMDKVGGGGSLSQPVQWRYGATSWTALSGTPATVSSGSLVGTRLVEFRQQVLSGDGVVEGDDYQLTATFRVQ